MVDSDAEIVSQPDTVAADRDALKLNDKHAYGVLIVGAGPAGVAAVYVARKGIIATDARRRWPTESVAA